LLYPLSYQGSWGGTDSASDLRLPRSLSTWRRLAQRRCSTELRRPPPMADARIDPLSVPSNGHSGRSGGLSAPSRPCAWRGGTWRSPGATVARRDGAELGMLAADLVVGADGVGSVVVACGRPGAVVARPVHAICVARSVGRTPRLAARAGDSRPPRLPDRDRRPPVCRYRGKPDCGSVRTYRPYRRLGAPGAARPGPVDADSEAVMLQTSDVSIDKEHVWPHRSPSGGSPRSAT
jgi:hypothetical protein